MQSDPRILNSRYALGASPRHGGTATVFKASDLENENRYVAVKLLDRGSGDIDLLNKLFQREVSALRRLEHPNIVHLLDGGRDEETGHRFLVFEWLSRDLGDVLEGRRGTPWDWTDFCEELGDGILSGLARAHELDIAHRDITPGNILITDDGDPRITDFGIAKIATEVAPGRTLAGFGTEPYAPPSGEDFEYLYTRDVYSFGVVALMALSGIDPHDAAYKDSPKQCIADALGTIDAPAAVFSFLDRCVSREAANRPRDATVALVELRRINAALRDEAARTAGADSRPVFYLKPSKKVREALRLDFDLQTDGQVERVLVEDLSDEVGLTTFKTEAFADGRSTEGHYQLLGAELRLHLEISQGHPEQIIIRRVSRDSSSFLERERERSFRFQAKFALESPKNKDAAADAVEQLRQSAVDHFADQQRADKARSHQRAFRVWRSTLSALTQLERGREQPLEYDEWKRHASAVEFFLPAQAPDDVLGQSRVAELVDGGLLSGEVIRLTSRGVLLRVDRGDARQLPRRGRLRVDTRMGRASLRRQELALDLVQRRAAVRPELESILIEPGSASSPTLGAEPTWVQDQLDDAKKRAVRAALGSSDVTLVEGPPGTGKTTFITELVLQELKRNPDARILVSSQTHAALDNVLERLQKLDEAIALLRLGRPGDERVSQQVRPLLIGDQLERWRKSVIREGRAALRSWARQHELSERDVEVAMRLEEAASITDALNDLQAGRAVMEEHFSELREQRRRGVDTASETVGSVQDELAALEAERTELDGNRTDLFERLRELGAITSPDELEGVSPDELRDRAEELVDRDHAAYEGCRARLRLLADWHGRFGRGPEFEAAALVRAQVVAATCVGFGGTPGWDTIEFDLCILDEASKATATEALIPMARAQRWVLVGDHRQLPPYVDEALLDESLMREFELTEDELRETLFERLRTRVPTEARFLLDTQHRMVPEIGELVSTVFYGGDLKSAPKGRPGWLGMALREPVVWLSTAHIGSRREQRSGTSHTNPLEARCVQNILGSLNLLAGGASEQLHVGVLSGYAEQRDELERRIAEKRLEWTNLQIDCNTVDAFQGREVDVAIYSVTRSNVGGRLGFLRERRRLNVALSRGKLGLVIVGDDHFAHRAEGDNPFAAVVDYIRSYQGCCIDEASP